MSAPRVVAVMRTSVSGHPIVWIAVVASLALSTQPSVAQSPRVLAGKVVNTTGQPIPGAIVQLQSDRGSYVTVNEMGQFRLAVSVDDSATIAVFMVGYDGRHFRLDTLHAMLGRGEAIVLSASSPQFVDSFPPIRPLNILDDTVPDLAAGAMARAAGLRPLYEYGAQSRREIRLTANFGLGAPDVLIVMRQDRGGIKGAVFHAYGRPFRHGDRVDTTALANAARQSRCTDPRVMDESAISEQRNYQHVTIVCRPRFRRSPNWKNLWRTLERLDVWTLPDDEELTRSGVIGTHGACIAVETFNGRYRRVEHCEGSLVASPESTRAEILVTLVKGVASIIR